MALIRFVSSNLLAVPIDGVKPTIIIASNFTGQSPITINGTGTPGAIVTIDLGLPTQLGALVAPDGTWTIDAPFVSGANRSMPVSISNENGVTLATSSIVENGPVVDPIININGVASGSPSTLASEGPQYAFDTLTYSKWLTGLPSTSAPANATNPGGGYLEYDYAAGVTNRVTSYSLTSAADDFGRDPKNWRLQGWDGTTWVTLDTQTNQLFASRGQTKRYFLATSSTLYSKHRLLVDQNNGSIETGAGGAGIVQLAEFELRGLGIAGPVAPQIVLTGLPSSVVSGQTYPITATANGLPVAGASVSINGVLVGTTNASGVLNVTMPAAANNVPVVVNASGYTSATQTITITAATVAPVFTSGNTADAQGNYTAIATGSPAPTFSINPSVAGWSINATTGVVTHPTITTNTTVQIQATNSAGTATQSVSFAAQTVAPVFTSGLSADAQGNYTAAATGTPAPTFSINPPVAGWSINPVTGVVAHPVLTANITVQIQATNSAGTASQSVSFVAQTVAPVFTSGSTSNSASQYTATATGTAPIVFSIAPAVAGWSIDPSTGVVTHPVISANQTITIVASNGTAPNASLAVSFVSNAPLQLVMSGLPSTTIPGQSYFVAATSNGVPVSAVDVSIAGVSFGVTDAFGYLTVVMPAAANNVLVVASRSGYVSANQVISIVAPTIAPTITSPVSALPVVSGSAPVYTATATGTLPIVWSLIGAPIGWSINASTGVITAPIITATQAIIVQASNGTSPNAMQAVVFAVNAVTPPPKVCINDPDTAIASAKTGKICLVYWPFRFPKRDK